MALGPSKMCFCSLRLLAVKIVQPYLYSSCVRPATTTAVTEEEEVEDKGALDDFTSQLIQRKSAKWERQKALLERKLRITPATLTDTVSDRIEHLPVEEINVLFERAIDAGDNSRIADLTRQCTEYDRLPSMLVLIQALSVCSRQGDKDTIMEVSRLCERLRPEILAENSHFEHYVAEAVWVRGNVVKSLEMFEKVYRENAFLRRKVRYILKHLILHSMKARSEASTVNLLNFSELLAEEHNDYFPLTCLWQTCILSEWFSDQNLSFDLLEKHGQLRHTVAGRIPFIVRLALKCDRIEVVYRLTELLLKFNMTWQIQQVLLELMNYWIHRGDIRQCREVLLWSINNDVNLPTSVYSESLVKLIANDNIGVLDKLQSRRPAATVATDYKF